MTVSERLSAVAPYARQLVDNEDVREAAQRALDASRESYQRARGKNARQAVTDKKLRRRLRAALGASAEFWAAMTAPQPQRKRRFWRKLTIVSVLGAGVFLAVNGDARAAVVNLVKSATNSNPGG
jgi:hypothetical protein